MGSKHFKELIRWKIFTTMRIVEAMKATIYILGIPTPSSFIQFLNSSKFSNVTIIFNTKL